MGLDQAALPSFGSQLGTSTERLKKQAEHMSAKGALSRHARGRSEGDFIKVSPVEIDELHEEEIVAPIDVTVNAVQPKDETVEPPSRERASSCFGLNDSFGANGAEEEECERKTELVDRPCSSASSGMSLNDSVLSSTSSSKEDNGQKR